MEQDKRQAVALMRYSAISPLIAGTQDDYASLNAFFRDVSAKGVRAPDGQLRHYSPGTIQKWYLGYRKSGFDALLPSGRSDRGVSRKIDPAIEEEIRHLKLTFPRLSAAEIFRQLRDKGSIKRGQLSESTVLRFINRMSETERQPAVQDMRRYERPHINEVWCGDSSVGPYLKLEDGKRQRVYVIALLDDASRFVTGADLFCSYKNRQMELLAARIGTVINYCHPYTPTQKAKIERWFRTLKDHWMASLDMRDFRSIDELRGSLYTYVHRYNQSPHSSLGGKSPQERFFSEPELIRRLPEDTVERSFLLEVERRVSADSVVVIDQVEYEVDCRFARQRVTLRYSPGMEDVYVVEAGGSLTPVRLLNKQENASVKREKVWLSKGGDDHDA